MGVYIEGAELPMEGNEIIIRIQPDGSILDQYGHHLSLKAIFVPKHGDLVDRDEIKFEWDEDFGTWVYDVYSAPVVIPGK